MKKKELIVSAIENGTVIDHISPGRALDVIRILHLENFEDSVAMAMNVPSKKIGRKDVVKISNRALSESEVNEIALVAPMATLSIIRNFEVVEKKQIDLPDVLHGIFPCINPNCITRTEGTPKYVVENKKPVVLRCYYCERIINEEDLPLRKSI